MRVRRFRLTMIFLAGILAGSMGGAVLGPDVTLAAFMALVIVPLMFLVSQFGFRRKDD